jgi:hypothetical protein
MAALAYNTSHLEWSDTQIAKGTKDLEEVRMDCCEVRTRFPKVSYLMYAGIVVGADIVMAPGLWCVKGWYESQLLCFGWIHLWVSTERRGNKGS